MDPDPGPVFPRNKNCKSAVVKIISETFMKDSQTSVDICSFSRPERASYICLHQLDSFMAVLSIRIRIRIDFGRPGPVTH